MPWKSSQTFTPATLDGRGRGSGRLRFSPNSAHAPLSRQPPRRSARGRNPVGVGWVDDREPKVACASQPWADGRNPAGIWTECDNADVFLLHLGACAIILP